MENFKEKLLEIKEKVGPTSIYINRIPKEIKTRFKEMARDEFMEDYGMLLKKLIEVYDGFYPKGNEEIVAKINYLANEILLIKTKLMESEKVPKNDIKMISGRRIGGKK